MWVQESLTCNVGYEPIYLHLLLSQRMAAIAQAQGRDSIRDQHQSWGRKRLRTWPAVILLVSTLPSYSPWGWAR